MIGFGLLSTAVAIPDIKNAHYLENNASEDILRSFDAKFDVYNMKLKNRSNVLVLEINF